MTDEIQRLLTQYREGDDEERKFGESTVKLKVYYYVFEYNSPYAEVRASIPNTDDPSLPVETFRAYFLGILFGGLFGAANQVISMASVY
jgi:hypothetical protein